MGVEMNISAITAKPVTAEDKNVGATTAPKSAQATRQDGTTPASDSANVSPSTKVTISSAARAALAEATETAQQTTQEAQSGDRQAINLLAKQAKSHAQH